MFRIRIWYADFGVVMASRVWRGRRALGLSVRVARLAGPGAAPARPAQHILTVYCLEWRFRMPETARPTHRQWRQEHCANPGTRTATRADTPAAAQPKRGGGSLPVHRSTAQRRGPEWVRCHVANSVSHFMLPLRGSPPVRASLQAYPSPKASRQVSSQQGPSARPSAAARRTAAMSRTK